MKINRYFSTPLPCPVKTDTKRCEAKVAKIAKMKKMTTNSVQLVFRQSKKKIFQTKKHNKTYSICVRKTIVGI